MYKPKVSIVIPVYNVSQYLRPCLESVLMQSLRDIEIICVDDGSTDDSPQILDSYARRDQRINVIHKENGGYGKAVNVGMDIARGEYFAILESDDVVHMSMYKTLYDIAHENQLDIVKANFGRFEINDGVFKLTKANIANKQSMYGRVIEDDPVFILHEAALYTWSGIYRLDFLRENNLRHNETPGASFQDNGFWFLTCAFAKRVWFHDEYFYMLRRDNPNSSTQSREKVYCIRDEYDYIYSFLKNYPTVYNRVVGIYWWARFGAYRWSLKRVADKYKPEFGQHFYETMRHAAEIGELNYAYFSDTSFRDLDLLLSDHLKFVDKFEGSSIQNNRNLQKRNYLNRLRWCYEDNGFSYTVKHTLQRMYKVGYGTVFHKKIVDERVEKVEKQLAQQRKEIQTLRIKIENTK